MAHVRGAWQLGGLGALGLTTVWTAAAGCWLDASGLKPATDVGASVPTGGTGGAGQGGGGIPCSSIADCPGEDTDCSYRTCLEERCGYEHHPAGNPCAGEEGRVCDGAGHCVLDGGQECVTPDQCLSGLCVDGVCCDASCDGVCRSCDQAGSPGQCVLHEARTDPDNECDGTGVCDGAAGCAFGDHLWSVGYGDLYDDRAFAVAVAADGSTVVVGQFEFDIDFGAGALTSRGSTDIFVVKLSAAGVRQWAKAFGSAGAGDADGALGVALDSAGNVVVVGYFSGAIDFSSPTPTNEQLTSAGQSDAFVLKLTSGGDFIWSRRIGGSRAEAAVAVAVDSSDGIIVAGSFASVGIEVGSTALVNAHSGGTNDLFLAKLDSLGTEQWASRHGDTSDQCLANIPCATLAVDAADHVVFAGGLAGEVDFGGGVLAGDGDADAVVVGLNAAGARLWDGRFGDDATQYVADVAVMSSNHILLTGAYEGTVDFDSGALPSSSVPSAFLARFDGAGVGVEARALAGSNGSAGRAIAVDARDNVSLFGQFGDTLGGTVALDSSVTLTSAGGQDLFLAKYGADQTLLWSHRFGDGYDEVGSAIGIDGLGNVLLAGDYQGQITFGATPLPYHHTSYHDVFVAKFRP